MKSYTNIEQSKKLVGILSPESADMFYDGIRNIDTNKYYIPHDSHPKVGKGYEGECPTNCVGTLFLPCWSLTALLNILHSRQNCIPSLSGGGYKDGNYISNWCLDYEYDNGDYQKIFADNPVDTCYEMILKLKGNNMI